MASVQCDGLVYDAASWNAADDPYMLYKTLRDEAPVFHDATRDLWVLSRYADVQAASRDWKSFSSAAGVHVGDFDRPFGPSALLSTDPPTHDALRGVVRRRFTPRAVESFAPAIEIRAERLVHDVLERGTADLAAEFGWALPLAVAAHALGLPDADVPYLRTLLARINQADPSLPQAEVGYVVPSSIEVPMTELARYFEDALLARRASPQDDALTDIASAESAGDLEAHERTGLCLLLFLAGIDTTSSLISNSLWHLAERTEEYDLLRDSAGSADAIEELLRFDSPVQSHTRRTTREVAIAGQTVPADTTVVLLYGSANRDERRWPGADILDLRREPLRNLAFGEGVHFCLGAPLARLEARIALAKFFEHVKRYDVREQPTRSRTDTDRGIVRLVARVKPQ